MNLTVLSIPCSRRHSSIRICEPNDFIRESQQTGTSHGLPSTEMRLSLPLVEARSAVSLRRKRVWLCIAFTCIFLFILSSLVLSGQVQYISSRERPPLRRLCRHRLRVPPKITHATRALRRPLRQPDRPLNVLEEHIWHGDGLLRVNPDGPHPLYQLIQRAESRWAQKQRRASKTLEEAISQYERRYKRSPPPGFEHWFVYSL